MKYIALLRGINISGKNKISMNELKTVLEKKNYQNVFTYLNSGNLIFESEILEKELIAKDIHKIIKDKFNLDIPIYIMNESFLKDILENAPTWWGTNDKEIYDNIIFIIPPLTHDEVYKVVGEPSKDIDKLKEYKNIIFWSYDLKKYQKSNWWTKTASTSIKDKITIRTANTVKRLNELCNK